MADEPPSKSKSIPLAIAAVLTFLVTYGVYFVKDLNGINHAKVHDIRDHWIVAQSLTADGQWVSYDQGEEAAYRPPLMHALTGAYTSMAEGTRHFNFYQYRDHSMALWNALFGGLALIFFWVAWQISKSPWFSSLLGSGMAVSSGYYNLQRWFGLLQFLAVLLLAFTVAYLLRALDDDHRGLGMASALLLMVAALATHESALVLLAGSGALSLATLLVHPNVMGVRRIGAKLLLGFAALGLIVLAADWLTVRNFASVIDNLGVAHANLFRFHDALIWSIFLATTVIASIALSLILNRETTIRRHVAHAGITNLMVLMVAFYVLGKLINGPMARSALGLLFGRSSLFLPIVATVLIALVFRRYGSSRPIALVGLAFLLTIFGLRTSSLFANPRATQLTSPPPGDQAVLTVGRKMPLLRTSHSPVHVTWPQDSSPGTDMIVSLYSSDTGELVRQQTTTFKGRHHVELDTLASPPPGRFRLEACIFNPESIPSCSQTNEYVRVYDILPYAGFRILIPVAFLAILAAPASLLMNAPAPTRQQGPGAHEILS